MSGKSELKLGATEYDDELRDINEYEDSRVGLTLSSSAKFSFDERGEFIFRGAPKLDVSRSSSGVRDPLVPKETQKNKLKKVTAFILQNTRKQIALQESAA